MYSLAVIRPWRVIMGPTEYCTTRQLSKLSRNLPRVWYHTFRIVGFLGSFPKVNTSWCREQREGRVIWPYHARVSSCLTPTLHRCLHISALFSVIRSLAIAALPWTLDLWSSRRTVYVGTGSSAEYSVLLSCHLCCGSSVIFRNVIFAHFSFSLTLSSHDSWMPT
jgi:hypothetical protein